MVVEGVRQNLIASLPKKVEVDEPFFGYTTVQRFRQAGVEMSRGADVSNAAAGGLDSLASMHLKDPVTLRPRDEPRPRKSKPSTLLCTDVRTGERFALEPMMSLMHLGSDVPGKVWARDLLVKGKLRTLIGYFPHVLWDNGQGGAE